MATTSVFEEAIHQSLSPIILTGPTDNIKDKFSKFLRTAYSPDKFLVLDTVGSTTIESLQALLTLRRADLSCIVIDSRGVTPHMWQKLLKLLENNTPSTRIIIISGGLIPRSIETRCFRCHIPIIPQDPSSYSGVEAFSVGSWLISVDTNNREQLLKSCQGWTQGHTDLLLEELGQQLLGSSTLQLDLEKRLSSTNRIMAAIYMLNEYINTPTVSMYTGLRLMS